MQAADPSEALDRAVRHHGRADGGKGGRKDGPAVLVGLIGRGIQASRTPTMHEREGERLGLACDYILIDFDQLGLADEALEAVLAAAEARGFAGLNVTHPYKQRVLAFLDGLSPEAEAIGAVNTVILRDGARIGHNTDCWGFAESLRGAMAGTPLGAVVQFGAGGAGAAVAHALLDLGVRDLAIVDTDAARAAALAARMGARFPARVRACEADAALFAACDGIVNTTPVGMDKYPGTPFPVAYLSPRHWVGEIVYFPRETALLRAARDLGCRTLAGTGMAVCQAVRAFELFTGLTPDRHAMSRHFEAAA